MMNKIYKVVFNQKLQVFQVVSEFAKGHSKAETPKALKKNMLPLSAKTWAAVLAAVARLIRQSCFCSGYGRCDRIQWDQYNRDFYRGCHRRSYGL